MTFLISRILVATDFSTSAGRALEYARVVARLWAAELHVLHVLEWYPGMDRDHAVNRMYLSDRRKEADQQFIGIKEQFTASAVSLQTQTAVGVPSEQIEHVANALSADLIVLGTHGRTGLQHILLGSTAERIVRIAPCPVLAVRTQPRETGAVAAAGSGSAVTIRRVLVPIDFSICSLDALEYAAHFAKQIGASVTLLHTLEPVAYNLDFTLDYASGRERAYWQGRLDVLQAILASNRIKVDCVLRAGRPAEAVASFLKEQPHDLVIMGTHGRRGISHLLMGSVAEATLRLAPCPVLTVRKPPFSAHHQRLLPTGDTG